MSYHVDSVCDYYARAFPYDAVASLVCGSTCKRASWGYVARQLALFYRKANGGVGVINRDARVIDGTGLRQLMASNRTMARIEIGPWLTSYGSDGGKLGGTMKQVVFDLDLDDFKDRAPQVVMDNQDAHTKAMGSIAWRHLSLSTWLLDLLVALRDGGRDRRSFAVFSGRRGCHLWLPETVVCKQTVSDYANKTEGFLKRLETRPFAQRVAELLRSKLGDDAARFFDEAADEIHKIRCLSGDNDDEIVTDAECIQLYRPALDTQVLKSVDHLIKAPFSVHHATGLISLPYDARDPPRRLADVSVLPHDATSSATFDRAVSILSGRC